MAESACKSPMGPVRRIVYEHAPAWLSGIWMAGAHYYHDFQASMRGVWNEENDEPWWEKGILGSKISPGGQIKHMG